VLVLDEVSSRVTGISPPQSLAVVFERPSVADAFAVAPHDGILDWRRSFDRVIRFRAGMFAQMDAMPIYVTNR